MIDELQGMLHAGESWERYFASGGLCVHVPS